jgi:MFS family permease
MFGANDTKRRVSRIGGAEAWVVWALATVFVVWLFALQTGYGVVSSRIQQDAQLEISQVAWAASIYAWVFALCQFFSGSLLDRHGTRPLLAAAVALVTLGVFLYAATTSFATLVFAQVVLAVGSSFGFVGAGYVGSQWFSAARYGLLFGLVQMCASFGSAVSQPIIIALLRNMHWRQLLYGFGAFGITLSLAFAWVVRNPAASNAAGPAFPGSGKRSLLGQIRADLETCLGNAQVMLSALFAGASFGTMLAVGVLWGPRVQMAHGASAEFAAVLTALGWLGLAFGAPLINVVSDRFCDRKKPAVIGLLLQAVAVACLIYLPASVGHAVSAVVMLAIGVFSGAHMLGFTIAGESVPPNLIGSASAVVNGVCFIVGGALVAVPGYLLPARPLLSDYQSTLWVMPSVLLVGSLCALALKSGGQGSTSREEKLAAARRSGASAQPG